ncbi:MAG: hypothetical protein H6622_12945 [Halobacteriovoraceae bacterium]|nr:hypothetical protein [Halobacteriovoraceae bacterium]
MGNFQLKLTKLTVVDNSEDEVLELAYELYEVMNNSVCYTKKEDDAQSRFKSLLNEGHFCYQSPTRAGRHFLEKYSDLY